MQMINTLSDPVRFAQALRGLAADAHRELRLAKTPSPAVLRDLTRRINRLSCALGDRREGPLATWLDNVARQVRSAADVCGPAVPPHVAECMPWAPAPAAAGF